MNLSVWKDKILLKKSEYILFTKDEYNLFVYLGLSIETIDNLAY